MITKKEAREWYEQYCKSGCCSYSFFDAGKDLGLIKKSLLEEARELEEQSIKEQTMKECDNSNGFNLMWNFK